VNTRFTARKGTTNERRYYISSHRLTARELLKHACLEWSVGTMHWLLDVRFGEDFCRVEDETFNNIKVYKEKTGSKRAMSKIMFDCLPDSETLLSVLSSSEI